MTRVKVRFLAIALPVGIAACSTSGAYPSLALRDVERVGGSAAPAAGDAGPVIPALPPASASLVTRLTGIVDVAQAADRQFQSILPTARRSVAAAGDRSSDSWSTASVELARLESARSSGMGALAELDVLYADARDAAPGQESPSADAIADARTKVSAITDAQDKVLAELTSRLRN